MARFRVTRSRDRQHIFVMFGPFGVIAEETIRYAAKRASLVAS